ncbi:50S ribosomal protein L11 methyltransferase [uncultured Friedmanniella sp.]|uniref:50S ribosomal protein L11 methyltransferase n=1 Tax=uncultured Friedmanniella sp. TaxID=335381 RepID=UPI0035CB5952
MSDVSDLWSSTDFPYACLRDRRRTGTLGRVVEATVRPGDTVLDAGAGTGILSLYAARAGARRVYAVEQDPVLCRFLRDTVGRNGYNDVITVVEGDARLVALPTVDVALVEMVETGLVEEHLVEVYNALVDRAVVDPRTRCLPAAYRTFVQPVATDDQFEGFHVVALRHDWSTYDQDPQLWGTSGWTATGDPVAVWSGAFAARPLDPTVSVRLEVPDPRADALRLTGELTMPDGSTAADFPTLNGPKIIPLAPRPPGGEALQLDYRMSGGFAGFTTTWLVDG